MTAGIYQLPEEHHELRAAVRALSEKQIAPFAAEVDAQARYPHEAREALTASGFHAIHLPEAYGGEGADPVAACIVTEEVARVCAGSSLIPAVNKLGSTPIESACRFQRAEPGGVGLCGSRHPRGSSARGGR